MRRCRCSMLRCRIGPGCGDRRPAGDRRGIGDDRGVAPDDPSPPPRPTLRLVTDNEPPDPLNARAGVMLTVAQAAEELGLSRAAFDALVRTGQLQTTVIGRRRFVPAREVDRRLLGLD